MEKPVRARSYFRIFEPILPPTQLRLLILLYRLTKYGHRNQWRKGLRDGKPIPYIEHPLRAAMILAKELHIFDPEMNAAAILHDILEDTDVLDGDLIEMLFGPNVARMVICLTKKPKRGYTKRLRHCRDWKTLMIKASDRLDNLRSMDGLSPDFVKKQAEETRAKYLPIFEKMVRVTPPEYAAEAESLFRKIMRQLRLLEKGATEKDAGEP